MRKPGRKTTPHCVHFTDMCWQMVLLIQEDMANKDMEEKSRASVIQDCVRNEFKRRKLTLRAKSSAPDDTPSPEV